MQAEDFAAGLRTCLDGGGAQHLWQQLRQQRDGLLLRGTSYDRAIATRHRHHPVARHQKAQRREPRAIKMCDRSRNSSVLGAAVGRRRFLSNRSRYEHSAEYLRVHSVAKIVGMIYAIPGEIEMAFTL